MASRPEETLRENNPATAGIERFFSLEGPREENNVRIFDSFDLIDPAGLSRVVLGCVGGSHKKLHRGNRRRHGQVRTGATAREGKGQPRMALC